MIFKGYVMRVVDGNKIDLQTLKRSIAKPKFFEKGTEKFWDDEYISEQMLKLHLDPNVESASRTKEAVEAETAFIKQVTGMNNTCAVLDLGCGPGIYVREFAKTGAKITGVDISERSIRYAAETIKSAYENANFTRLDYLDMTLKVSFDVVTLIFYDFCALNSDEQEKLLLKIHEALKDDGVFIFDLVSENRKTTILTNVTVCEGGGFWSPNPYIEILNTFLYESPKTEGIQYTIIGEDGTIKITRIYHRLFGLQEITKLLNDHGFKVERIYKNLKGEALSEGSETFGIFARKTKIKG